MDILYRLVFFLLLISFTYGQDDFFEIGEIQIPPKILVELKTQYKLDPDNFRQKDSTEHKVFRVNDKYLLWFSYWSQEDIYTMIVYTDSSQILSSKEYIDRIPASLVVDKHKFVRINFRYGYPTYRDIIATYYEMREGFLLEMASVLLKINPTLIWADPFDHLFAIESKIKAAFEKVSEYWVTNISLDYSIYKSTIAQWKEKGKKSLSPHKFNVQIRFIDGLFHSIESDSELLKDQLECFYRGLDNISDKCLELYGVDRDTIPYLLVFVEDPFLILMKSLSLSE